MAGRLDWSGFGITPERFISEAQAFRDFMANLAAPLDEKKEAYKLLVEHAAMLDPMARGYARAGVALKEACCSWLDSGNEPR